MLALTRYPGERVILDVPGPCRIEIENVCSYGRVKLGFVAPLNVKIWRQELGQLRKVPTVANGSTKTGPPMVSEQPNGRKAAS
jgi:sRNA-binding carbon storage regulator CsrA